MKKLFITAMLLSIILTGCKKDEEISYTDYSPYAKIIDEYELEYGEMEKVKSEYGSFYNATGFIYANLIDLDSNGVLELALANSTNINEIEIYTLVDNELKSLGSLQTDIKNHSSVVVFSNANDKNYIISDTGIAGVTEILELNGEALEKVVTLEEEIVVLGTTGTYEIDGEIVDFDEYNEKLNSYGAPENYIIHKLTEFTSEEYEERQILIHKTKIMLSDHPY